MEELKNYPNPAPVKVREHDNDFANARVAVPLQLSTEAGVLSFWSATTVFGTPLEVTLAELALESFFPADAETADIMRRINQNP